MSLPIELLYVIEKYISDTSSYLKLRLLSKKYNKKFQIIKYFKDNKLNKQIKFINNGIHIFKNNKLIEKYTFYNFGQYKYQNFCNDIQHLVYNKPPYKLTYKKLTKSKIFQKICNINEDDEILEKEYCCIS